MSELISLTRDQIKRFIPSARDIQVRVERDHHHYRSKIHVQLPGTVLHADKKSDSLFDALELSCQAILKQVSRLKTKKNRQRLPLKKWAKA